MTREGPHPLTLGPVDAPLYDGRHEHDACGVGFVADLDGRHAPRVVGMALEALAALAHRGARGADDATGDGAGISIPLTARFRDRIVAEADVPLPAGSRVAIGMCFLPADNPAGMRLVEAAVADAGLQVAGWRAVPVDASMTADRRSSRTPDVRQAIVTTPAPMAARPFTRRLAIARRMAETRAAAAGLVDLSIASLSAQTVVYKGLFVGDEIGRFYRDLARDDLDARYAIFHQRYSTNTFPSWGLAQPFAYLAHNGEINTVRANREAMRGRRRWLGRAAWMRRLVEAGPLVSEDGSDSRALDDAAELLVLGGVTIDEAMATLVPAAGGLGGEEDEGPALIEPWDGPAALVFGDGRRVGAMLDRNGLRPLALTTTRDGLVVVSSEAGSIALPSSRVERRHRLGPGERVVADVRRGTLVGPSQPARQRRSVHIGRARSSEPPAIGAETDARARVALELDNETLRQIVRPMALEGHEATWSMGDDTPIAPLATRPRRVSAYLRQAFAQVTNPALDPQREAVVMSLRMTIGRQAMLLAEDGAETGADVVPVDGPVLDAAAWSDLLGRFGAPRVARLDATWARRAGGAGLARALDRLGRQARAAIRRRATLIVISDRAVGESRIPVPALLAVARVHRELTAAGARSRTDLVVEAGDAFDVHDAAMLIAAGASAVHPWQLLELAAEHAGARGSEDLTVERAIGNTIEALHAGLRKVLARMGVSTLASYRGGQLFDVLGLEPTVVAELFPAAGCWPGRVGLAELGQQRVDAHRRGYDAPKPALEDPGRVRFRGSGERHAFAPTIVKATQALAREPGDIAERLALYRGTVHDGAADQPRHLLGLRPAAAPVPLDEVEPASMIVRRFVSSAMSLGALSPEAHQAISIGMARLGASSNSGEGGEDPAWYAAEGPDRRDAAIKQVASARFGVTAEYLARAEQIEIKIAQGSKPGEGGQLPGRKATAFIAGLRRGQPGMTMISPPPHHDIYSIEDLAQLIGDLRAVSPSARIGVKLVSGRGIGTIAAGVAKAHADYVLVSGHAGGTGASPLSSIKHVGLPWELGLAEVHQVLIRNRLRDRVALRTDGGLRTGRDIVTAAALGAEEFGFGTAALVAIGCDMARQCHLDTCPTGIATQREDLRAKFDGTPEHIVAFFTAIAEDVRRELAALGLRTVGEAVGRVDLLSVADAPALEVVPVIAGPRWTREVGRDRPPKDLGPTAVPPPDRSFEAEVLADVARRAEAGEEVVIERTVTTQDRSVGARLAGMLARRAEPRRLPRVRYLLHGSAGQSLGAFAVPGMRIVVEGEANDYVGKGLSGGTIVVRPDPAQPADAISSTQALAGNVCLYGATGGVLHVLGRAGIRFAVRNSGARAVVTDIGAHGCEYMTGGTVVVLGSVGPNFGAGMTGGRAFLRKTDALAAQLNHESVATRPLDAADESVLRELLTAHADEGSARATALLEAWDPAGFVAVVPRDADAVVTPAEASSEVAELAIAR